MGNVQTCQSVGGGILYKFSFTMFPCLCTILWCTSISMVYTYFCHICDNWLLTWLFGHFQWVWTLTLLSCVCVNANVVDVLSKNCKGDPLSHRIMDNLGVVYPPCRLQLHAKESFNQHLNVIKGAFFLPPQEGGQQH